MSLPAVAPQQPQGAGGCAILMSPNSPPSGQTAAPCPPLGAAENASAAASSTPASGGSSPQGDLVAGASAPAAPSQAGGMCAAYLSDEVTARSDMEESDTNKTKVSDSAYSTSCNSRSQRSSGSSKSRHSGSSNSSGYGGHLSTLGSVTEFTQPASKRCKDKKKKGNRCVIVLPAPAENTELSDIACAVQDVQPKDVCGENTESGSGRGLGLGPELVFGGCTSPHDKEALQMAAINQTLCFIQKLKTTTDEPTIATDNIEERQQTISCHTNTSTEKTVRGKLCNKTSGKEEFMAIISMSDGIVKYTSAGITEVLGFPNDMWIGRSITDFVQPKDLAAFASHITSGVANPLSQLDKDSGRKTPLFCSLRSYRGLKRCGFGVKDKAVQFRPCQLLLTFRGHLNGFTLPDDIPEGADQPLIYLVVTVNPIRSAYTYPEETRSLPKFATRLLASTQLTEVDPECVPYLGFLPQDMIGRSVLEFYHPEDMPFMKDVYEAVISKQGVPFLSKPYRFRSQNGGYVLLETEWSSFCNPWSRKLEFIIAQHRVVQGPINPDVFSAPAEIDVTSQISEEVLKESKVIQEEIQNILSEQTKSSSAENSKKRLLSKRCKVLASLMDSMIEENDKPDLRLEVPPEDQSFSERDSVMLGEISPHHEYYDSKSSSETPPSYNQLNYNDNIQRFFESKPKTTISDKSGKEKGGSPGKNSPEQDSSLGSGDSGSGGGSGELNGSHGSATSSSHNSYQQPPLTQALLVRHNENMEKRLVQRHREQRSKGDKREKYQKALPAGSHAPHGVKRIGSHSWENDSFKGSKHLHVEANIGSAPPAALACAVLGLPAGAGAGPRAGPSQPAEQVGPKAPGPGSGLPVAGPGPGPPVSGAASLTVPVPVPGARYGNVPPLFQSSSNSVWPPFSVTVTPLPTTQPSGPYSSLPVMGPTPHMMPMYCMGMGPQEHLGTARLPPRNPFLPAATYLPTSPNTLQLVYQPYPHSLLYPPLSMLHPAATMLPTSLFPPGTCVPTEPAQSCHPLPQNPQTRSAGAQSTQQHQAQPQQAHPKPLQGQAQQQEQLRINVEAGSCHIQGKLQRPPSQATSVKAEPGSALGSVASASRKALSVTPNKNKSLSPLMSPDVDKAMGERNQRRDRLDAQVEEGSYFSSHYFFLCTDNSDDSMRSCINPLHDKGCSRCSQPDSVSGESVTLPPARLRPMRSGPPPWMEGVSLTQETMLLYEMHKRDVDDVLSSDLNALGRIEQPVLVNEQLDQLYEDLQLEGASTRLALEEASDSSSEEWAPLLTHKKERSRRFMEYGRLIMIFEDEVPMPSPAATVVT